MTDQPPEFKSVGWHLILHDMFNLAKEEIIINEQLTETEMPNLWNLYYTAKDDAVVLLERDESDLRATKFLEDDKVLNEKYGSGIEHRMTKEERRERLDAAYMFYKRLRVFDLEEREQEWRDDQLLLARKEEQNAK